MKSEAIGAVLRGGRRMLFLGLVRRFPRRWWIAGAGAVVALGVLFTYVSPVVLDPIFNKFSRCDRASCGATCSRSPTRAGVDVGEVYRIDASRRTTGVNAYVNGIGQTKRVVLYDNLIDEFPRDQVNSIVAHELGHVHYRDVPKGLLWLAIVAPFAMLARAAADRADRRP